MSDSLSEKKRVYVSIAQHGICHICGSHEDLRCGVCWGCSDQVAGEEVSPGVHRLWDSRNPRNEWFYSDSGH